MAVYTELSLAMADRVAREHGLGGARGVEPVLAGSVNSNFFVDADARRVFVRIYEEQDIEGLAYEWSLLTHLQRAGLPVPVRVSGPGPGSLRVAGKPLGVFEVIGGDESCQARIDEGRAEAVGAFLGRAHRAGQTFPIRRQGRFGRPALRARVAEVKALRRAELADALQEVGGALDAVDAAWDTSLPSGIVHGDLFRDNVRWEGPRIVGALDWESASHGLYVYDLAVCLLSWCYGDAFRWDLARAMARGYEGVRPLEWAERRFLPVALTAAAARFTITRITDYHLRAGSAQVHKDYRRFLARLRLVRATDRWAARLASRAAQPRRGGG
ncbi:MAG: homoserine kinase [Sandaracinaceae bacterium]